MKHTRLLERVLTGLVVLAMVFGWTPLVVQPAQAVSTTVVISQVYGGGGNANAQYQNDFVELYNLGSSPVDMSTWTIQYASSAGSTWSRSYLTGTILPGRYYLVQEAVGSSCGGQPCGSPLPTPNDIGGLLLSASAGKVALVSNNLALSGACPTGLVDFVGFGGANCSEGSPTPALSNTTAAIRLGGGTKDTDNNSADFTVGIPVPHNTPPPDLPPSVKSTVPADGAVDVPLNSSITINFSEPVNVAGSWFSLVCALSGTHAATVTGGPSTFTLDPGTDFVGGESCTLTVYAANVTDQDLNDPPDNMTLNFTAGFSTYAPPIPIGVVNGPVLDTDDGAGHKSPYAGKTVKIQGVIYEKTLQATATASTYKGFFIQNNAETVDVDPNTSDGLFVYLGTGGTLPGPNGPYTPAVGDEIVLMGKVSEYYNMTELVAPFVVSEILRSGVDIDAEVPPVVANPPANLADANRYWERLQGMRVQVPTGSIVTGGRNVFSPADAEIWVASPDSTIAQRTDPYTRRAFRDAHPLDDNYDPANWDGNGYRILMGSLGIKALPGNTAQTLIDPARTFDTLTNAPAGGLNYTYSKYRIEIAAQPTFNEGPDPSVVNPFQVFDRSVYYSIVDYNLENLYDYRDNPFSGCDFNNASNPMCPAVAPFRDDVKPSYDYVPASDAAYQARLTDIATQIINDLHSPDILMVQEVENQDICSVTDGVFTCGTTDNADRKPDVLQELALRVASLGGPAYDAAFDRDSSDLRGIAPAYLYRTDRVQLLDPTGDPILGTSPTVGGYTAVPYDGDVSNPKTFNAVLPPLADNSAPCETNWVFPRAPDVGLFRIYSTSVGVGNYADVYTINNHFKSGPDSCVLHRTEQAKYNAALVATIQAAKPDARVVVAGDLNVYPRPDDPFAPIGQPKSSDQLGSLYNSSLGLKNLWEVLLDKAPQSAYSYVYLGMAQTLDQMFVNAPMLTDLAQFRIAHINSDFPADYPGDVARGTSDHDPNVATFFINQPPTVDAGGPYAVIEGQSISLTAAGSDPENGPLTYAWDLDNDGVFETPGQTVTYNAGLFAPDVKTVSVQVTDNGGQTGTATVGISLLYRFDGFYPPVGNPSTLNQVAAGKAIPIKFSLGADKGLAVFADGYPQVAEFSCGTDCPVDDVQETVTAGSSSLTYDPVLNQYIYVWKTDKAWAGTSRQLIVKLADGTTHTLYFTFK